MPQEFSLHSKVERNIDVLLDIVSLELTPGLPDDGGPGPVPEPLTDPLLEEESDVGPVLHHQLTRPLQRDPQRQQHAPLPPPLPPQTRGQQSGQGGHALPQPRPGGAGRLAD